MLRTNFLFKLIKTISYLFVVAICVLASATANAQELSFFEDFNGAGVPPNHADYWYNMNEIYPSQSSWYDFIPGDGHVYITVDNSSSWGDYQGLGIGWIPIVGRRIEVRMKGAILPGYVGFIFTYASSADEIDIELLADDTQGEGGVHDPYAWSDARFNTTIHGQNWNSNFQGIVDDTGIKVSHYEDDTYHTYTIDHFGDKVVFYIDGVYQETCTWSIPKDNSEIILGFRDLDFAGEPNWSGTRTLTIDWLNVQPIDANSPVAAADRYATDPNTTINIGGSGILSNDTGNGLSAQLLSDVEHGTLTLNINGSFTYVPDNGFIGVDHFVYYADDGTDKGTSNSSRVLLKVGQPIKWQKVDDSHANIAYSSNWGTYVGSGGYLNTEYYSETVGAESTFTFTGNQARYYGFKRNDLGYVDIEVDGVPVTTLDLYSPTFFGDYMLYETDILSWGVHTLTVRVNGTQNASSSGFEVNTDAFSWLDLGSGGNAAPTANFTFSTSELTASFTDNSTDSDGTIESWEWDFGDGNISNSQNPSHTYAADNTYTVTLTVTDNDGETNSTSKSVTVPATLNSPPNPNPMTWSVKPHKDPAWPTDIVGSMTASVATDTDGGIEYFFDCIEAPEGGNWNGGEDSGWLTANTFSDWHLLDGYTYTYQVKARDALGNETDWSANATLTIGGSTPVDLATSLVVYLPFNGNYTDASGRDNHASIGANSDHDPTLHASGGKVGGYVEINDFGGGAVNSSYLTLGNPTDIDFGTGTDFTIITWFRAEANQLGDPAIMGNKDWVSGSNAGVLLSANEESGDDFGLNIADGTLRHDIQPIDYNFNEWWFLAVTVKRDGTAVLFVGDQNGVTSELSEVVSDLNNITSTLPWNIGQDGTGSYPNNLDADLDEMAIWNRALSLDEIRQIYNNGSGIDLNNLLSGGNVAPYASFTSGISNLVVDFTDTSTDSDGTIESWAWNFGDDNTSTSQNESHAYATYGTYSVTLTVTDNEGASSSITKFIEVTSGQSVSFLTQPYLQRVHTSGITIMWELSDVESCVVDYGTDNNYGSINSASPSATTSASTEIYKSVITGLSAGTVYHYRVNINGVSGNDRTFKTAPNGDADFSFGQWGDSQTVNAATIPMLQHLAASGVDIAVPTGDMVGDGNNYDDIRSVFLEQTIDYVARTIPLDIAWGNHDGEGDTQIKKFTAFGADNYSFDYANCHFTIIHYASWYGSSVSSWVEADLAAAQGARHRFVFVHTPPYCERWYNGDSELRNDFVPLFEQYDVDIVFSGHTHSYLRGELNGVYYVISGGGGWLDSAEDLEYDWAHMTVGGYTDTWSAYGIEGGLVNEYVKVDVTSTGWTATMQGFNSDGTIKNGVVDVFSSSTNQQATANIEVMTWVPSYAISNCQTSANADFGACSPKDVLTRVGLQFWLAEYNGTLSYNSDVSDAEVAWWTDWGATNGIKILLTVYNNDGAWNWSRAVSAFANNRTTFVNSLIAEMERLNLDGIDLDLEGIGDFESDRSAFSQFVTELSAALKSRGKILTIDAFHYIWNAPNHNWYSDWLGKVDNIHSMGYDDLYEGGDTWHKYSYQQNAGIVAGYPATTVLMGMPEWIETWGTSTGYGTDALGHVKEVRYSLPEGPTGIAIWDFQLGAASWQNSDTWCEIAAMKGSDTTPTANFTYAPTDLTVDLTVDFTDASTDSDGTIVNWLWNFGDGSTSTAQSPLHTYAEDGTYTVTLTVTDNEGATDNSTQTLTVCLDTDDDGVCDADDECPNDPNKIAPGDCGCGVADTDSDGDGTPDCIDDCNTETAEFTVNPLTHSGTGSDSTTIDLPENSQNVSFTISNISERARPTSKNYTELVTVNYINGNGDHVTDTTVSADGGSTFNVDIPGPVQNITVSLTDGGDGNSGTSTMSIDFSPVTYCVQSEPCSDDDGDGVCDDVDQCPGWDDSIDTDEDGVPDGCDICEGFDDNVDTNGNGIPDGCEEPCTDDDEDGFCDDVDDQCLGWDDALLGTSCDDGNDCTTNDVYVDCDDCQGTLEPDTDGDGICDPIDICPDLDNALIGTACNDGDACTTGETYDTNCNCSGGVYTDNDGDGVCAVDDPDDNDPCNPDPNSPACTPEPCGDIIADDFDIDMGNWTLGGGSAVRVAANAVSGEYSIKLSDDLGIVSSMYSNTLDLLTYTEVYFNFSYYPVGMDQGDAFLLEISTDGGTSYSEVHTWVYGTDFNVNKIRYNESVTVSIIDGFSYNTVFRIRCDATFKKDEVYIDDVVITDCTTKSAIINTKNFETIKPTVKVYPNPASQFLNIAFSNYEEEKSILSIYNLNGQLNRNIELELNSKMVHQIDLNGFSDGLYLIRITSTRGNILGIERFVINKNK